MADYPYNFAGILEAIAGGINNFTKTRNDLDVLRQERARQEAMDQAQIAYQNAQVRLEGQRVGIEEKRFGADVQELRDKLTAAGLDAKQAELVIAGMRNDISAARSEMAANEAANQRQLLQLMKTAGIGPNGEPLGGIPPSVRDNLITAMNDQLDQILADNPADAALKRRIYGLKLTLPMAIASGNFGPADAQKLLDELYPPAAPGQQPLPGKPENQFGSTPFARGLGILGQSIFGGPPATPAIPGTQQIEALGKGLKYLFTPEKVAGAASEMQNLAAPPDTAAGRVAARRAADRKRLNQRIQM